MKTIIIFFGTCCSLLLSAFASGAPQAPAGQNYIKTRTYCSPNNQTYYDDIQYFDGLGKLFLFVNIEATPATNKDLISLTEYDALGRKSIEWLPLPLATASGYATSENIKSAARGVGGYNDDMPYTGYGYEDSPDARVLEVRAPGQEFQEPGPASENMYLLNDASDSLCCFLLELDATTRPATVRNKGVATTGTLFVTRSVDADGQVKYDFKNARDERVLMRQKSEEGIFTDTYYVYDDLGNLSFVLPPELAALLTPGNSYTTEDPSFAAYGYSYEYDERNRCTARKFPGADWVYYGYDRTDKLVLTQDGELRRKGLWLVTISDVFGRVAISGLSSNAELSSRKFNLQSVQAVFDPNATSTYCYRTNCGIDLAALQILEVHFYDNYNHRSALPDYFGTLSYVSLAGYGTRFGSDTNVVTAKGLETGCLYAVLPYNETLLGANYYYDQKNRMIQSRMQTLHGGLYSENLAYDFIGNVLSRRESCQPRPGVSTDVLIYNYTYDKRGRLKSETVSLNGTVGSPYLCSYDDFGRLISTTQGSGSNAVTTMRQYNIRNWLTSQQNSLFEMSLAYDKPQFLTTKPSYMGNITEWTWQYGSADAENTYAFSYDKLSRLTDTKHYIDTTACDLFVEKNLSYDRHGNIRSLTRTDSSKSHTYTYGYNGNHLTTLSDGVADYAYAYDRNGNMTHDGFNSLDVSYNHLNLIEKLMNGDTIIANYSYLSNGTKLSAVNSDGNGLEYQGSLVYKKDQNGIFLESAEFTGGRFIVTTNGIETCYHLTDHLGSVRVVVGADAEVVERNNYYPFGLRWNSAEEQVSDNRYRYNGKENQAFAGVPYLDYGARMYDPRLAVWHVLDPSLESNQTETPYGYCSNNPLKFMDIAGLTKFLAITMGKDVQYRGRIMAANNPSIEHHSLNGGIGGLISTLKNVSSQDENGIGFMAIWSHGVPNKIFPKGHFNSGISTADLDELNEAIKNGEIAFAKGAIIYLGGCNAGRYKTPTDETNFAQKLAEITGAIVIAANDLVIPVNESRGELIYSIAHKKVSGIGFFRYNGKKHQRDAAGRKVNVMSLLDEAIEWTNLHQRFDSAPISAGVKIFVRNIIDVNPNVSVYIK